MTTFSLTDAFPGLYDVRRLDDPRLRLVVPEVALSPDRLRNALRVGQQNVLREHRAGVPIVVGTDAPPPWPDAIYHFHGPQVAREIEPVHEAGLSPLESIAAATSTPARMLGLDGEIGTGGDASQDVRALRDVRWTVRDGVARTPEEWMREAPGA